MEETKVESGDGELIAAFVKGDEKAFELLYCRYKRQLYGFLNHLIGNNPDEADEVFEETWLRVLQKLPKYRDEGKFSAWLFRIGRNIFLDRLRKNRNESITIALDAENAPVQLGPESLEPDRDFELGELEEVIVRAVACLPLEQREVFLLRQQDLAFKEIAQIQECSINTALGRMQYAIKNLRVSLKTGLR
ncbi:MAG: sigma-70 family RNA polymerase sigma factor [Victivallales bacterium]|nr:sigma-70 family RNA polymerase sigma factor [Victivallales bacterium]